MTTTIAHSGGTITPVAVEGYRASRPARTVVHDVLNRENPDVTLRVFGLRTGSLRLVFRGEAEALSAFAALSIPQTLSASNTDVDAIAMSFVVAGGNLDLEQDDDDTALWRIIVPFREVRP